MPKPELYSKKSQTEITLNNSNMWDHQQWDPEHFCLLSTENIFLVLEHISSCINPFGIYKHWIQVPALEWSENQILKMSSSFCYKPMPAISGAVWESGQHLHCPQVLKNAATLQSTKT